MCNRQSMRKGKPKKALDSENSEPNKEQNRASKKKAKKAVAQAKAAAYQQLYDDLDTPDGQNRAIRIARKRDKGIANAKQVRTEAEI